MCGSLHSTFKTSFQPYAFYKKKGYKLLFIDQLVRSEATRSFKSAAGRPTTFVHRIKPSATRRQNMLRSQQLRNRSPAIGSRPSGSRRTSKFLSTLATVNFLEWRLFEIVLKSSQLRSGFKYSPTEKFPMVLAQAQCDHDKSVADGFLLTQGRTQDGFGICSYDTADCKTQHYCYETTHMFNSYL